MFGGYDGCESGDSGDRACGWCGAVGVVEVFCIVRMGVGVGSAGNKDGCVVNNGGNASVTDGGTDGGGPRWRDCCRFPDGVFRELQKRCEGVFFTSVEVKPELASLDLVGKSGTDMNAC